MTPGQWRIMRWSRFVLRKVFVGPTVGWARFCANSLLRCADRSIDPLYVIQSCFGVDASRTNRLSCAPVFFNLFVFFVEIFIIILTLAIIATIEIRDKLIKVSVGGLVRLQCRRSAVVPDEPSNAEQDREACVALLFCPRPQRAPAVPAANNRWNVATAASNTRPNGATAPQQRSIAHAQRRAAYPRRRPLSHSTCSPTESCCPHPVLLQYE